ncbi:MAG: selenocysteine-specific translation elongation factor [Terriglobales bacterium]
MIIGTAGHIDHGKSALVEALTGVHPDRLEEERRRGITLDLGFGHWQQEGERIGVVDVPGHERFVHTMLAGAGGMDAVLLVVAADAGVQPQTREHLAICSLLGVGQGVIAISKRDLVDAAQAARVRGQIAKLVAGTALARAPVIEVSARTRDGIEQLRAALVAAGRQAGARHAEAPFRLPLDRAFSMKGHGAVVTGTLVQGRLRAGGEAELAPLGTRVRVRGLQVHGASVAEAAAGQRVAANLAGIETARLHRGMEVVETGVFALTRALAAEITWLPEAARLPHRARCRLHLYTSDTVAALLWLEAPRWAQLQLAEPVVAAPGDRFILRQLSPAATLAGGVVVDPQPPPHRRAGYAAAAAFLAELASAATLDQRLRLHLERAGTEGRDLAALGRATGRRVSEVESALAAAAAEGGCVGSAHPAAALAASALAAIESDLEGALAAFHRREPMAEGVATEALGLPYAVHWLAAAAARLRTAGRLEGVAGGRFRLRSAGPARSAEQLELRQRLEEHLRGLGWSAPPLPQALAAFAQPAVRALIADLARSGVLVECQPGWFLHASALARLRALLAEKKQRAPAFSVGEFKQWTGLSRKLAIPLLEYCDRARLTRRTGETRVIL